MRTKKKNKTEINMLECIMYDRMQSSYQYYQNFEAFILISVVRMTFAFRTMKNVTFTDVNFC